jgi:hypothetical protein
MKVKQPAWKTMPVLDVRPLPDDVITQLSEAFTLRQFLAVSKTGTD